ncbi:MAG: alpha/beta fold hydrolase, partial [Myxococcota bacterium]
RPGTEKKVLWFDPQRKQTTSFSLVFVHGYGASRQELSPLCEDLGKALHANVFLTRLAGHGVTPAQMKEGTVRRWAQDVREAIAIGRRIGNKVIVIGSSTGATLAMWATTQPFAQDILAHIWFSPNIGPKDKRSNVLLLPWGKRIGRMIAGPIRTWEPANPEQGKYWTTQQPISSLAAMMGLVQVVRKIDVLRLSQPVLIFYSPKDQVLDVNKIRQMFQRMQSPRKKLIPILNSGDPASHVLAGRILSPQTTSPVKQHILDFLTPHVAHIHPQNNTASTSAPSSARGTTPKPAPTSSDNPKNKQ